MLKELTALCLMLTVAWFPAAIAEDEDSITNPVCRVDPTGVTCGTCANQGPRTMVGFNFPLSIDGGIANDVQYGAVGQIDPIDVDGAPYKYGVNYGGFVARADKCYPEEKYDPPVLGMWTKIF